MVLTNVNAKVQWQMKINEGKMFTIDRTTKEAKQGASTQPKEPAQDEPQRGSEKPKQQPLEGSAEDNADRANDTTAEEKGLWDVAAEKAALEGGSTVKIFQAMKKKLKAKEKKQAAIAA